MLIEVLELAVGSLLTCSLLSLSSLEKYFQVAGLLLSLEGLTLADPGPPQHPYVEFIAGNTNLVLSAPHDGTVEPPNIPVRQPGCRREESGGGCQFGSGEQCPADQQCRVITGRDTASAELARVVFTKYLELTGLTPHLVISHLHRSRLDPNRDLPEAAQGSQEAIRAYQAFHGSIEAAHQSLGNRPGLHLDFHGYRDILKQNNTMIGYLYRKQELNNADFTRSTPSIQALLNRTGIPAEEFVFGEGSLGSMFEKSGYRAVPSPRQPRPGKDKYYRGGWITQVHGSRDGGNIDAIQLEFPTEIRMEVSKERRERFAEELAHNIVNFMELYYQI